MGVGGLTKRCEVRDGGRACAERTPNMRFISVTLNVLKFTGWLKESAPCRVERRECDRGEMRAGRREN